MKSKSAENFKDKQYQARADLTTRDIEKLRTQDGIPSCGLANRQGTGLSVEVQRLQVTKRARFFQRGLSCQLKLAKAFMMQLFIEAQQIVVVDLWPVDLGACMNDDGIVDCRGQFLILISKKSCFFAVTTFACNRFQAEISFCAL
ncbi:unnamed protein product [Peronospora belbahrii]|uniref:Uncharacterized protein n=1 Tax=Peronospora belbahrii TaxID=622444 RepID=A0AAU9L1F8_9STRA|nr:unnamed protein product [Peronospora belbahrii]